MNIRPIRDIDEQKLVHEVAQADGSHLYWPTHIIRRDSGLIIGTLSIMPTVILWSKKCMLPRESLQVKDFYEGLLANQSRVISVPCPKDSAYLEQLQKESQGYLAAGEVKLFFKGL